MQMIVPEQAATPTSESQTSSDLSRANRQAIVDADNLEIAAKRVSQDAARGVAQKAFVDGEQIGTPTPAHETVVTVSGVPSVGRNDIPERMYGLSIAFLVTCAVVAIGVPIARALARRMDRGSSTTPDSARSVDPLRRMEQTMEAMALEIERLSGEQRFVQELLASPVPERVPAAAARD